MKLITPYLIRFALVAVALTVAFRFCLSYAIEHKMYVALIITAVVYGGLMALAGWNFGKKDGEYLPILDVGFRFHFTTYIVHNLISELWFAFGFNASYEKVRVIHLTALIWAVFLLAHFCFYLWARKKSIDGLDKSDLFE